MLQLTHYIFVTRAGAGGTFPKPALHALCKLLIFLSSPEGAIDKADVESWMPSPVDLAELDKTCGMHVWGLMNALALGARAYERLGRDDDAAAAAQFGIDQHKKKVQARHSEAFSFLTSVFASGCHRRLPLCARASASPA